MDREASVWFGLLSLFFFFFFFPAYQKLFIRRGDDLDQRVTQIPRQQDQVGKECQRGR